MKSIFKREYNDTYDTKQTKTTTYSSEYNLNTSNYNSKEFNSYNEKATKSPSFLDVFGAKILSAIIAFVTGIAAISIITNTINLIDKISTNENYVNFQLNLKEHKNYLDIKINYYPKDTPSYKQTLSYNLISDINNIKIEDLEFNSNYIIEITKENKIIEKKEFKTKLPFENFLLLDSLTPMAFIHLKENNQKEYFIAGYANESIINESIQKIEKNIFNYSLNELKICEKLIVFTKNTDNTINVLFNLDLFLEYRLPLLSFELSDELIISHPSAHDYNLNIEIILNNEIIKKENLTNENNKLVFKPGNENFNKLYNIKIHNKNNNITFQGIFMFITKEE